jgi:hypothetical protein
MELQLMTMPKIATKIINLLYLVRFFSFLYKAAPRFELGVKVLQTSALPLGYAADPVFSQQNLS